MANMMPMLMMNMMKGDGGNTLLGNGGKSSPFFKG
jgi:hypothetical protein